MRNPSRKPSLNVTALALAALMALTTSGAAAAQVKLDARMAKRALLADEEQTTFLKVSLAGLARNDGKARAPVNVAIVVDKSGSMGGEKIQKAKEAAIMVVDRLDSKDIVSVVAYDTNISVLVPAIRVAEKAAIRAAINRLAAGGNTALFAGVSKGAAEVRKFLDKHRVNRVILLSDGLANVGPSGPAQLGELGASLIKEGISVSTIGLGANYNEDLMAQLARRSDGNHYFAENAADLARIFKGELGDVLSVCAQNVTVEIKCANGIRPVRVLGRDADITGRNVTVILNQLYTSQAKYVLLEVEVPVTATGKTRKVAAVTVSYTNLATKAAEKLTAAAAVTFTKSKERAKDATNNDVMIAVVEQISINTNVQAVALRDAGKVQEAQRMLISNAAYLSSNAAAFGSARLRALAAFNRRNSARLSEKDWALERKAMRADQVQRQFQQENK